MSSSESEMCSKYRLPTHPVTAKLFFSDGREEQVTLFLKTAAENHFGPESLDEFLNDSRQFFPVRSQSNGKSFLIHRDSVKRIEVDDNAPILSHMKANLAPCVDLVRIEMTDATVLEGTLASFSPPETMRMSDFFNMKEEFVPLEIEQGVTYVNKRYITVVWL